MVFLIISAIRIVPAEFGFNIWKNNELLLLDKGKLPSVLGDAVDCQKKNVRLYRESREL